MTPDQREIVTWLSRCSFGFRLGAHRALRDFTRMAERGDKLTLLQQDWLYSLAHTYRRQLPERITGAAHRLHALIEPAVRAERERRGVVVEERRARSGRVPCRQQLMLFPSAEMADGGRDVSASRTARERLARPQPA